MDLDRPMYRWRQMTPAERQKVLSQRQAQSLPWHGPPHFENETGHYLITAACFDHKPIIGLCPERLAHFETELLEKVHKSCLQVFAWVVLPNHYHLIVHAPRVKSLLEALGKLHGGTSYRWNGEENCRGRQVWHRAVETAIQSEAHFWATMNYVLHNAVRHGYVECWQDWPFSNAAQYLEEIGRDEAEWRWKEYPILDYGKDWDPPEL